MKRHKDALKRARQSTRRTERNQSAVSRLKTLKKKVLEAKTAEERETAIRAYASATGKASAKGIIHRKKASRDLSRASKAGAGKGGKK